MKICFLLITGILIFNSSCMENKSKQMPTFQEGISNGYLQKEYPFPVKRYCQILRLKNDPELIAEYIEWHSKVWPEVLEGIKKVGILDHEIYIHDDILFMILVTPVDFDFEKQMGLLATLPRQAEWEEFMSKYQQSDPGASSGEKWTLMPRVFKLK